MKLFYKGQYFEITNEIITCFWILLGMLLIMILQ